LLTHRQTKTGKNITSLAEVMKATACSLDFSSFFCFISVYLISVGFSVWCYVCSTYSGERRLRKNAKQNKWVVYWHFSLSDL